MARPSNESRLESDRRQGHSRVLATYKTDDGYRLGVWTGKQRQKKAEGTFVDLERQQRLEALPGWSWTPQVDRLDTFWELGFSHLKQFTDREGHSRVPASYKTEKGYDLGIWVRRQREKKANGTFVDLERQQRLEALPGWSWTLVVVLKTLWESRFGILKQFTEREGHSQVAFSFTTDSGFKLGRWVAKQRVRQNLMDADCIQRLETLPGWVWKNES